MLTSPLAWILREPPPVSTDSPKVSNVCHGRISINSLATGFRVEKFWFTPFLSPFWGKPGFPLLQKKSSECTSNNYHLQWPEYNLLLKNCLCVSDNVRGWSIEPGEQPTRTKPNPTTSQHIGWGCFNPSSRQYHHQNIHWQTKCLRLNCGILFKPPPPPPTHPPKIENYLIYHRQWINFPRY